MKHTLTKYDAAGNIFLLTRTTSALFSEKRKAVYGELAVRMCALQTGAGADGLLVVSSSRRADFTLDVFNADGSWAERSGNGLRAAVTFVGKDSPRRSRWSVACGAEVVSARILRNSSRNGAIVSAEVGYPVFAKPTALQLEEGKLPTLQALKAGAGLLRYLGVAIGNPHAVVPVKAFPRNWEKLGEQVTRSRRFKNGVNVEFVKVVNSRKLEVRVFERGVGPTGSSGTGACAAVAALKALGKVSAKALVCFPEQELTVNWSATTKPISVTGYAKELFTVQVKV